MANYNKRGRACIINVSDTQKVEAFFESVGCPTHLSAYKLNAKSVAKEVSERFISRGGGGIGERGDIVPAEVVKIIESRA